jgi:DnaA regulatory inactivator Hda
MTSKQLVFDLSLRPAYGREDFLIAPSNEQAVTRVEQWPDWPSHALCLVGPKGSGKTHLAHVWREMSGAVYLKGEALIEADLKNLLVKQAVIVEDADLGVNEVSLFHLYNALAREGGHLFLTGQTPPSAWAMALPDLKSRLATITIAELQAPDDTLLSALMVKQFQDRQIKVDPKVLSFIIKRIERSFESVEEVVKRLDRAALETKGRITVALARSVLDGDK